MAAVAATIYYMLYIDWCPFLLLDTSLCQPRKKKIVIIYFTDPRGESLNCFVNIMNNFSDYRTLARLPGSLYSFTANYIRSI